MAAPTTSTRTEALMGQAADYLWYAGTLLAVLALIFAVAWIAQRVGPYAVRAAGGSRRLRLVESLPLDTKRRILLVRRDRTEHLILVGLNGEMLLESVRYAERPAAERAAAEPPAEAGYRAAAPQRPAADPAPGPHNQNPQAWRGG